MPKFTGLKYDDDCGYYAVRNGRIVCPADGISGMKANAEHALNNNISFDLRSSLSADWRRMWTPYLIFPTLEDYQRGELQ